MNTVLKRVKRKTPSFFKKVRNIGLTLAAFSAAIIASPVALPILIIKIAGYAAGAGSVMGAVSQTAVTNDKQ